MPSTPETRVTQGGVFASGAGGPLVRVTQASTLAAYGSPTISTRTTSALSLVAGKYVMPINVTQAAGLVAAFSSLNIRVTQAGALIAGRGRVYNPKLRAWTFTLDGHDFYVLKLSDEKTLVYDLSTQQWSWFSSPDVNYWRLTCGFNWASAGKVPYENGSNVIVGDDTYGILWVLNPEQGYDDDPRGIYGTFPSQPYQRRATGQMIARGRDTVPCYEVYLTANLGAPAIAGQQVTLNYSDNQGQSFVTAGSITVNANDFGQEFSWRSLGLIRAPGRIFSVEDNGALARIDGLDVSDGS